MEDFIDDTDQQREGVSFYRQLDPENNEHYHRFPNQTRNPKEAVFWRRGLTTRSMGS